MKTSLAHPIVVYGLVGREGPEMGKLITMIRLVAVTNKKDQRMMTHGG